MKRTFRIFGLVFAAALCCSCNFGAEVLSDMIGAETACSGNVTKSGNVYTFTPDAEKSKLSTFYMLPEGYNKSLTLEYTDGSMQLLQSTVPAYRAIDFVKEGSGINGMWKGLLTGESMISGVELEISGGKTFTYKVQSLRREIKGSTTVQCDNVTVKDGTALGGTINDGGTSGVYPHVFGKVFFDGLKVKGKNAEKLCFGNTEYFSRVSDETGTDTYTYKGSRLLSNDCELKITTVSGSFKAVLTIPKTAKLILEE